MSVDTHLLTGAYATHSLPNSEEPSFERHLVECAACRTEVQELEATAARMGSWLTGAAPYGMRARVLAEVGRTRQLPPREPAPALRFRWHPSVLAVAASVVLLIVVLVVNASLREQVSEAAEQRPAIARILTAPDVTWTSATGVSGVSGRVVVAPSQGSGVFFASGLAAAPSGSTYQGWLIDADGGIRSAGLFAPNADATAVLLLTDDLATAREFAITVEPAGGSDQPTVLPPVLGVSVPA
jgi:anti-sigma-K factor RskA